MTITVTFCDRALTLAAIHCEPSWLERLLLGAKTLNDLVIGRPAPGGSLLWIHESTGRRVRSRRIVDAIELARRRCEQRLATA